MPTESSVADQMVRLTPSQVGSRVFWRTRSSTVLKMEQMVALWGLDGERRREGDGRRTLGRGRRPGGGPIGCGSGVGRWRGR